MHSFAIVMLIAGFCVPVLAAQNATLGRELSSPVTASVILFSVALPHPISILRMAGIMIIAVGFGLHNILRELKKCNYM